VAVLASFVHRARRLEHLLKHSLLFTLLDHAWIEYLLLELRLGHSFSLLGLPCMFFLWALLGSKILVFVIFL